MDWRREGYPESLPSQEVATDNELTNEVRDHPAPKARVAEPGRTSPKRLSLTLSGRRACST